MITSRPKFRSPAWTQLDPQVSSRSLILPGADGRIRAFPRGENGEQWTSEQLGETTTLEVSEEFVVSQSAKGLTGLSSKDGRALWSRENSEPVVGMDNGILVTKGRRDVVALDASNGQALWSSPSLSLPLIQGGRAYLTTGKSGEFESLEARNLSSGEKLWSVSDGDIEHVLLGSQGLFYSNRKLGKHSETLQFLSSRDPSGKGRWTHQCQGLLRSKPLLSPDADKLALHQRDPNNPGGGLLTILDSTSGQVLLSVSTEFDLQAAFLPEGSVLLSEIEFSRTPGQEKKQLRAVGIDGQDLWIRPGTPDWLAAGESLLVAEGESLTRLDPLTGQTLWRREIAPKTAPVWSRENEILLLEGGCALHKVNLTDGSTLSYESQGEKLLLSSIKDDTLVVASHEGEVWEESLPTASNHQFVGRWESPNPFHISSLAAPSTLSEEDAVFVDWDGNGKEDPHDPIMVDSKRKPITWKALLQRDQDSDNKLDSSSLSDLSLWFDIDRDGQVSPGELSALTSGSFDKARLEFDTKLLWVAADSRCGKA